MFRLCQRSRAEIRGGSRSEIGATRRSVERVWWKAMMQHSAGRTASSARDNGRARLIRIGTEILSEKGFDGTGLEELLNRANTPKGSFYYYFHSKSEFGLAVVDNYAHLWEQKLTRLLRDPKVKPLDRIANYIVEGVRGLEKYSFKRGCLIGNMSQEILNLDEAFRNKIVKIFENWSAYIAACLDEAKQTGDLDPRADTMLIADFFWMGWEGAVLKAKLECSAQPVLKFREIFFTRIVAGPRARR